jgi:transposase
MKDEKLENSVVTLHGRKWSIRRISDELGISRGRVRRILASNTDVRDTTPQYCPPVKRQGNSKLDPYKDFIAELIDQYSDITGQRIFERLKQRGYNGGITIVRDYLQSVRHVNSKEPVRMVETNPGQRAAHDWSDYNICFTKDKEGESTQVTFFSYILCYSRRQYIEVVEDKTRKTLLRALINAFIYLDGVPYEIKSDNQKACVDRWEYGRPVFNRRYLEFATHYRFSPKAIRPGRPQENLNVKFIIM